MREGQNLQAGEPTPQRLPGPPLDLPYERLFDFVHDNQATLIIHADSEGWQLGLYWFGVMGFTKFESDGRDPADAARSFLQARERVSP